MITASALVIAGCQRRCRVSSALTVAMRAKLTTMIATSSRFGSRDVAALMRLLRAVATSFSSPTRVL